MIKKLTVLSFIFLSISLFAQEFNEDVRPKVGLVLSGGGAKGFAHIGVLKVIEETGVQIDYIAGTSMGAVIGAMYAANYSAIEIDKIINSFDFMSLLQDKIPRAQSAFFEKQYGEKHLLSFPITNKGEITLPGAIARGQSVYNELNALFEHVNDIESFDALPIPFFCMTTDLETGESVLLDKGSLAESVRASASMPTLLEPFEIGSRAFIDGGVSDNFPVEEMKSRGSNIIIGVDVQGKLDKKEDINSVVSVLNQIVNYKMYERDDKNIKELTIHIRPNTTDFSFTSFDKSVDIISEGYRSATNYVQSLESIRRLQEKYEVRKKNISNKKRISRKVTEIKINSLENYSSKTIRGKMNLELGDSISFSELNHKINRLSAGNDFDIVKYNFKNLGEDKNRLELNITENKYTSSLNLGLHYDNLYGASALINFTTKHLLLKNDIFTTDIILGDNFRANINYYVDNGIYTSYGISSRLNTLSTEVKYNNTEVNRITKNYADFSTLAYVQTSFNRMFAIGLGLEHKFLEVQTKSLVLDDVEIDKFYFEKSHFLNSLAYIKLDTYDNKFFPKNGVFVDGELKYYMASSDFNENFSQFSQAKLTLSAAKTIFDKLTFHLIVAGGLTFGNNTSRQFRFALGGYSENMINNHIPFYGYEFEDNENNAYLKGALELRYEIVEKHSLAIITNYGKTDLDVFNDGQVFKDVLSGYAIAYGYKSIFGPVRFVRDWTPDRRLSHWYLSVGFWF